MSNEILLYGTLGCHLCTEAEAWLANSYPDISLKKIDIADEEALVARYGIRIPVLAKGEQEHDWPFDETVVAALVAHEAAATSAMPTSISAPQRRVWHIGASKE
ncbi:glutaredoxin family protein [Marinomonas ostreistagni]|uniref:glutaredoxin family protein n=1 Tax=Marinomonas ostreistagni TaxID=359209 RepID=UPI00195132B9|nr:glutaredoxin family protein [Marinomonas ostreistagni]MBM6550022.1 glutaredoxin family protein [Marinomonas ostreistagni]